jgi:putative ABC transport system ATP-binding protein/macrolide transport system ATP-binding/permease protein/lipoprotein-releasing system ATP-binding protein
MIRVDGMGKRYTGERAIDAVSDVSIDLEPGKFLAIVGRSGSGKSTLLGMIGGISRPTTGAVTIDGINQWSLHDAAHSDFRNRTIGYVFQFASLLPTLRAIDNVALPALIGGVLDYREAYARARMLLSRVGLAGRADFFPGQLSGGEQRRVAIARALINFPKVLLADEPTADLDEETEQEILELLLDVHAEFGTTLLIVTHNPAIADRADQLLQMDNGRVIRIANRLERSILIVRSLGAQASCLPNEVVHLGAGIDRLVGRLVLFLIPFVLAIWGFNSAVAAYQSGMIQAKAAQESALEELAMNDLRADVRDVTEGSGKSYTLTLYLKNTRGERPIYVMSPTVRAFIQIGSSWHEVPLRSADGSLPQVLKITGDHVFHYTFEPDATDYAQLLPYYMHIRFTNDMLISPSSQPKDDLVERSDSYYVYLKPHDADDSAILSKLKFPGDPPVWIAMPPH